VRKITPFPWFDDQAEEAVDYYVTLFRDSRFETVTPYDEACFPREERRDRAAGSSAGMGSRGRSSRPSWGSYSTTRIRPKPGA
jgi:hypothetical protein